MEQDDMSHLDVVLLAITHGPDSCCTAHFWEPATINVVMIDSEAPIALVGAAIVDMQAAR